MRTDILVHVVGLFGSENSSYSIALEVKESGQTLPENFMHRTVLCTYVEYKCDSYFGFDLLLHVPIYVKKNNTDYMYEIKASIYDPQCWVGRNGNNAIQYIFPIARFTTSTEEGQFPEILSSCVI